MAKKKRFQTRVECVRMDPEEQSLCQRKSIPHRTANHRECTGLPCGSMCKKDKGPRYTRPSAYMLSLACRIVLEVFPRQGRGMVRSLSCISSRTWYLLEEAYV